MDIVSLITKYSHINLIWFISFFTCFVFFFYYVPLNRNRNPMYCPVHSICPFICPSIKGILSAPFPIYEFYILVKYFMGAVLDYCYGLRETPVCAKARFSNVSYVPFIFPKGTL